MGLDFIEEGPKSQLAIEGCQHFDIGSLHCQCLRIELDRDIQIDRSQPFCQKDLIVRRFDIFALFPFQLICMFQQILYRSKLTD